MVPSRILHTLAMAAFSLLIGHPAFAQTPPSQADAKKAAARAAQLYVDAICGETFVKVDPAKVVALVPWDAKHDRSEATYAVLWSGDLGATGGSGSTAAYITIVTVCMGDTFVVEPTRSSPVINYEAPVRGIERIISSTKDSMTLEGLTLGPNDPNCCPSIRNRFTLKLDANGNWARFSAKANDKPSKVKR